MYDIHFYAYTPDEKGKVKIILDVEAQKKYHTGHDFVTRGFFYTSRIISAQLGKEFVLIPSRYLSKADCRAKPGGAYFLSVGDTVFSPPTTDARLTIQFISLSTFHLEVRRILVFLIKLPSFLKRIFHIYHFLEKKHFYKKNLVVKISLCEENVAGSGKSS